MKTDGVLCTDGRTLGDRDIRRALATNIASGSMGTLWASVCLGIPVTMFLKALGASGLELGLAVTVQQLAVLAQVPATLLTEHLPARKPFWAWISIPHRMVWVAPVAIPFILGGMPHVATLWMVGVIALSALLANGGVPLWFSWMADLVPERVSGRFWGTRQSLLMVSFLAGNLVSGYFLDLFPDPATGGSFVGFALIFGLAAILGTSDIVLHMRIPEPVPKGPDRSLSVAARLLAPLREPDFRWLTLAMGAWTFSTGLHASFAPVYLKEQFNFSYLQLTYLPVCAALGTMAAGIPLGRLIDRSGARTIGVILMIAAPLTASVWFLLAPGTVSPDLPILGRVTLPQAVAVLALGHVAAGALYGGIGLCQVHLAGTLAPRSGRTMAMAVHWSVVGLTAAVGPTLGGLFMDFMRAHPIALTLPSGLPVSYFQILVLVHVLIAWSLCAPAMARVKRKAGELPLRLVLARIAVGNPLRAVEALAAFAGVAVDKVQRTVKAITHDDTPPDAPRH